MSRWFTGFLDAVLCCSNGLADTPSSIIVDGRSLVPLRYIAETRRGQLGKDGRVDVIFAPDFETVKAVLPVARLSPPVKHADLEITRAGFTLVTLDATDTLLPCVTERPAAEAEEGESRTIVYSAVPQDLRAAFGELSP